ncbi:hypothetical protein L1987_33241 [Smallanthus sonchifolius]|uniref:Uncharacterized protein n=1 Tax=Smallanthus sonchifolius TaxID=185202 RepID=A0ACB9HR60_9ASTR|nr:hypothetical protein L1987_33241 [Smallanthus sonchifolius]
MLTEIPRHQQQGKVIDMPSPLTSLARSQEHKGKRKLESSPTQDYSNSPKRLVNSQLILKEKIYLILQPQKA